VNDGGNEPNVQQHSTDLGKGLHQQIHGKAREGNTKSERCPNIHSAHCGTDAVEPLQDIKMMVNFVGVGKWTDDRDSVPRYGVGR